MRYLFYDDAGNIHTTYYATPPAELMTKQHVKVDEISEPEAKPGKDAILKVNIETKELYYDYVDHVDSPEEQEEKELKLLKLQVEAQSAMADMRDDLLQDLILKAYN